MPNKFARYAAFVLVYNLAVVLWGAFVRATGSGAGCGNHWPLCNGAVLPQTPAFTTIIEFAHRASSGIDVALVALLVVWAFRAFPRGHAARLGAALSALFLVTEALIGAALVKLEYVEQNASVGRAYSLSAHLVNTLTLLACLTLTVWWGAGGARLRLRGATAWMATPGIALVILAGIGGAIAALGDTLFPADSLAAAFRQDFNPAASIFLRLRLLHPLLALLAAGWLVFYAVHSMNRRGSKPFAWGVLALVGAQLAAGISNLLLLAPIWMQLLHLLLADLLWITLVLLAASRLQESTLPADMATDEMVSGFPGLQRVGPK